MSTNLLIMSLINYTDYFVVTFLNPIPIMLALCLMLSTTYYQYAQNYAGIIGLGLNLSIHLTAELELAD